MCLRHMPWQDDPGSSGVALRDKFTQYQLRSHGLQLFIQFSAYRLSPGSFLAIGLVARSLVEQAREHLKECSWVPLGADPNDASRKIKGKITLLEGTEHHNLDYGVLQVTCTLERCGMCPTERWPAFSRSLVHQCPDAWHP